MDYHVQHVLDFDHRFLFVFRILDYCLLINISRYTQRILDDGLLNVLTFGSRKVLVGTNAAADL